jgi:hypothetical protein
MQGLLSENAQPARSSLQHVHAIGVMRRVVFVQHVISDECRNVF